MEQVIECYEAVQTGVKDRALVHADIGHRAGPPEVYARPWQQWHRLHRGAASLRSIFKERIYLAKANSTVMHNEITLIDHALTRPCTVDKHYHRNPVSAAHMAGGFLRAQFAPSGRHGELFHKRRRLPDGGPQGRTPPEIFQADGRPPLDRELRLCRRYAHT
jgi:hypothetical protein